MLSVLSAIARAMEKTIPLNKHMKALEFGAGTGLLSFLLADRLAEITLMDNSTEMINVIKGKISGQEMHSYETCFDKPGTGGLSGTFRYYIQPDGIASCE